MRTAAIIVIATAALGFGFGCGVEEDPPRPRVTRSGPDLASMTLEERKAATAKYDSEASKYFIPAEGKTGGNLEADAEACRKKLIADRSYIQTNDLVRFLRNVECMKQKGWKVKPELLPEGVELD